jgi:arylsulfatase A-like enzyme
MTSVVWAVGLAVGTPAAGAAADRPNVILILVDDMGHGDCQAYNPGSAIDMPHVEALAGAGIRFTNAHSGAALCAPSRYSVMTGNYSYRGRKDKGVWPAYDPQTMVIPGQLTLGQLMRTAGYGTAIFGKLNNGGAFWNIAGTGYTSTHTEIDFTRPFDRGPTDPVEGLGFDYAFNLLVGIQAKPYAFFENDRLVRYDSLLGTFAPFATSQDAQDAFVSVTQGQTYNGGKIGKAGYAMDNYDSRAAGPFLTSKALAFIDSHLQANAAAGTDDPFFLYYAAQAAHSPYTPPPNFNPGNPTDVGNTSDPTGVPVEGATPISPRTDMIYESNVVLGELMAKLQAEGILANTMIIFTSDNGAAKAGTWTGTQFYSEKMGDYGGDRIETGLGGDEHVNAQGEIDGVAFRADKGEIYEGGHRVPLIVRWGDGTPGGSRIAPGSVTGQMTGLQDIMATLAALTGQSLEADQACDSFSMLPVILGQRSEDDPARDNMIIQGRQPDSATAGYDDLGRCLYEYDGNGVLWKLVLGVHATDHTTGYQAFELYNLSADTGETVDLYDDPAQQDRVAAMTQRYEDLILAGRTAPPVSPGSSVPDWAAY